MWFKTTVRIFITYKNESFCIETQQMSNFFLLHKFSAFLIALLYKNARRKKNV